jgi:tryptophan synthase alpha chain
MKKACRIKQLFDSQKAYIAYLTAGDGGMQQTLDAALALIAGGVNMLEIGIPFSDPIADGPIIQRAASRSLSAGTTSNDVLWLIKQIRQHSDIPLVLFTYLNPILATLSSGFLTEAKNAGVDGLLLVDCPMEESQFIREQCIQHDIALITVITPSTSIARMQHIQRHAKGFIYYACRKGTTGVRNALPHDLQQKISCIKSMINLPIVAGFGISTRKMAQSVLEHADGVVVGSLFVKALEDGMQPADLTTLAQDIFSQNKSCID